MNRKIFCALLALVCLFSFKAEAAVSGSNIRLGVMKFLSRAEGVSADHAAAVGDVFARMLTSSKTISVIERDQLDAIASEHKLVMSGMITEQSAVQIGKLAGCQYMLLGSVTNLEKSGSSTNIWLWGTSKYSAVATIDVRVVNVETSEVVLSLSETGTSSQTGTTLNIYGMTTEKVKLEGMEAGAIADATSRLSLKVREALTGEYAQVLEAGGKEITLSIGGTSGAQHGKLFRVYVDGPEIHDADGSSLGHKMNDIAVVKIVDVQRDFSIAESAGKGAGNVNLIRRGDKIYPVTPEELQSLIKRKNFPSSRPKEMQLDSDMEEFLKDAKKSSSSSKSSSSTRTKSKSKKSGRN